jgi:hypothetical protein
VKVVVSKRGARSVRRIDAYWKLHADQPSIFALEMVEALDLLSTTRSPGSPFPTKLRPTLKRLLLRKSYCHVYFIFDERRQMIEIVQVWDARRGTPPRL